MYIKIGNQETLFMVCALALIHVQFDFYSLKLTEDPLVILVIDVMTILIITPLNLRDIV